MEPDHAISMLDGMLWKAALISAPLLVAILIIGIAISILQVVIQVQELTLTFVPKLIVTTLILVFLGSWMMRQVSQFAERLFLSILSLTQ